MLIFPGGGYGNLAEHEGKGYAEWFAVEYGYKRSQTARPPKKITRRHHPVSVPTKKQA